MIATMRTSRTLAIVHTLLTSLVLSAQPAIEWQKVLGGTRGDYAESIRQTTDGGYIVAGCTNSTDVDVDGWHEGYQWGEPTHDAWVVKLNAVGDIEWQRVLGGAGEDRALEVEQTPDGGYILAGYTESNDGDVTDYHGIRDVWVVKLDATGAIQWQKCLGGTADDLGNSIQNTSDNGFIVAGYTFSSNGDVSGIHGSRDAWLVKMDANGDILWQKCLGGSDQDYAASVVQTTDGGYVLAGTTFSNNGDVDGMHGGRDAWVVKLNADAEIQWQRCIGGSLDEEAYSIVQTTAGGYVITGYVHSSDGDVSGYHGGRDAWAIGLDAAGAIQWQRCFGGTETDDFQSVQQASNGDHIAVGRTRSTDGDASGCSGSNGYDMWAVRFSSDGTLLWQKCLGGGGGEYGRSIQRTSENGFVIAGYSNGNGGDVSGSPQGAEIGGNIWVVKLGPSEVGIAEEPRPMLNIAPNPACSLVTIGFAGTSSVREIAILDATGRTTMAQPPATSTGSLTVDVSGHEPGLYLLQVRFANGSQCTERIVKE